jgi:hypothetical protein
MDAEGLARREKHLEFFLAGALLIFGIYQSVLYFGHTIVPNSDFPAFFETGRELLSFRAPSSFKRVPVLGILQVCLSYLVGGQHPGLTAGWLLNAILHPFNLILLWLVARQVVGRGSLWLAVVAIINPQVVYLLTEPIAETTLLFFTLLTFYFIFKHSNLSYLFASITTMVRYEGAALIMAAFVMDMIYRKNGRERIRALLYSIIATIPLAIWMLGTLLNWQAEGTHYLSLFGEEYSRLYHESAKTRTGFIRHLDVLWQTGFRPLLMPSPRAASSFAAGVFKLSKTIAVVAFFFGSIYGLCRRKWNMLALLLFLVPYFWIHAKFPSPLPRYHMPVFWIALLICLFGLQGIWRLIDRNERVPKAVVVTLQLLLAATALIWFVSVVSYLPRIAALSPRSASLPWVAVILVGSIFGAGILVYRARYLARQLAVAAIMCLFIVSNQYTLVVTVGDGQKEKEFKQLADWYVTEAGPAGEKMGLYMANVVKIFAPRYAEHIVKLPKAESEEKFVEACYAEDITYVVWATREGLSKDHTGYRQIGLDKNIDRLKYARDAEPYQFVKKVGWQKGYVHIFRLLRPPKPSNQEPPDQ